MTLIRLQPEQGFTPFWPFRLLWRITPSLTPLDKTCYGLPRCATRYHALATWVYGAGRAAVPSGEARLSNPAASHLHGTQHGAWTAGGSKRGIAGKKKKHRGDFVCGLPTISRTKSVRDASNLCTKTLSLTPSMRTVNGITAVVLRRANGSSQRHKSNRTSRRRVPLPHREDRQSHKAVPILPQSRSMPLASLQRYAPVTSAPSVTEPSCVHALAHVSCRLAPGRGQAPAGVSPSPSPPWGSTWAASCGHATQVPLSSVPQAQ